MLVSHAEVSLHLPAMKIAPFREREEQIHFQGLSLIAEFNIIVDRMFAVYNNNLSRKRTVQGCLMVKMIITLLGQCQSVLNICK